MDITPLIDKMRTAFADVEQRMADPSVFDDRDAYQQLAREHQRLGGLLSAYDDLARCREQLSENREMLDEEEDEEFLEVLRRDIADLEATLPGLDTRVMALLLPPDADDSRNTIVEIRPAAGGDEAALFAADLLRMYLRFAEEQRWKAEILSRTDTPLGGIKDVSVSIQGDDVYRYLRFESGVHRVQRVPVTETQGRIHTSTITVAVLPEVQDVDIRINPEDLRVDVFRASGAGGQHVNTTDSAVRITHLPSGLSVASQQERSQHRNREIAMRLLRAHLWEQKRREEEARYAAERKQQVGSGERSERIRTYNFPQNRITDHRYGLSWFNLPGMLEGGLEDMFEQILAADTTRRLEQELKGV